MKIKYKKTDNLPQTVVKEIIVNPDHEMRLIVKEAPKGYAVKAVDRRRDRTIVTYELTA